MHEDEWDRKRRLRMAANANAVAMDKDAEIARLKAALEVERKACDFAANAVEDASFDEEGYVDEYRDRLSDWFKDWQARRSAERAAQEKQT